MCISQQPTGNTEPNVEPTSISVSATITTGTTTVPQTNKTTNERRPSWRLRIDNGCKVCEKESEFKYYILSLVYLSVSCDTWFIFLH